MAYRTISITTDTPMKEGVASGGITPGHLIERTSTADQVQVHALEGGWAQRLFAIEDEKQGKEIGDAYATGTLVFFRNFLPGDEVYVRIKNGEAIAIGDKLVSAGDGTLREAIPDSSEVMMEEDVLVIALEACDMSGSSGADPAGGLCRVEIKG